MSDTVFGYDELCNRCMGNIELVERVVAAFEEGFADDLEHLRELVATGKIAEAAKLAHKMKGASANAAAYQLREITEDIEREAHVEESDRRLCDHFNELQLAWQSFTSEVGTRNETKTR